MVVEFFKNLGRQKMNAVQAQANAKVAGAQAKAKAKAAGAVNKAAKSAGNKAKGAAKGAVKKGGAGKDAKDAQKDDEAMGLFRRGKKGPEEAGPQSPDVEPEFGDKTQFIQVAEERPKECVGWVVAVSGDQKGQDFRLVPGKNVLGTAADCDIVLTDQYMSARHSVIRYENGTFVMVDLDSTNGTYVNDARCSKEELIDNDRLRLGRTDLKFKSLY